MIEIHYSIFEKYQRRQKRFDEMVTLSMILGLSTRKTEEEVSSLLNDLYRRGLVGKHLKVVASDGAKGIRSAINMIYPYDRWQLCYVHKLRGLNKNIRHKVKNRGKMIKEASLIYKSGTKSEAIERFNSFCHEWQDIEPHAIKCFKDNFYDTLHFYDFKDDKNFIASTNHIERDLEEVRRRIKIQGYFRSDRSVNLWVFGIIKQFRQKQEPYGMPDEHVVRIFRNPKFEFAQLS